ncbi:MAG: hypothetical protein ACREP6_16355 [Candidatus Binataceae bacterium]
MNEPSRKSNRMIFFAGLSGLMLLLLTGAGVRAGAEQAPQAASGVNAAGAAVSLTPKQHAVAMRSLCGGLISAAAAARAGQSKKATRKVAYLTAEQSIAQNLHVTNARAHTILQSLLNERKSAMAEGQAGRSISKWACHGAAAANKASQ